MTTGIIYREPACDLTDAGLLDSILKMLQACSDIGTASLEVTRFGAINTYSGSLDTQQLTDHIFDGRTEFGELRTITRIHLSLGDTTKDATEAAFIRGAKGTEIAFSSSRVRAAEQAKTSAVQQAQQNNPHPQAQQSATKAAAEAGDTKIQKATQEALPRILRLVAAANSHGLIRPRLNDAAHPDTATVQALAEQVAAFRDIITTQARNNEETRKRLLEEHDKRTADLFAEHEARLKRITQDLAAREQETNEKLKQKERELQSLAEALKDREQRLDLRTERDARRDLRTQIQTAAKQMFEKPDLSEDAKKSFERVTRACWWTIWGAIAVLGTAFFGPPLLEIWFGRALSTETVWLVWSMRILGGITLAAALIYYVSSLSAWSRQVAAIELRSKQFALDVDRASWLVEMALEYEKEGKALPPAMVESFTRGLFDGGAQGAQHEPPSASLLHLIQNAESLKVGAAGAELVLTGKQIRKADAQAGKNP